MTPSGHRMLGAPRGGGNARCSVPLDDRGFSEVQLHSDLTQEELVSGAQGCGLDQLAVEERAADRAKVGEARHGFGNFQAAMCAGNAGMLDRQIVVVAPAEAVGARRQVLLPSLGRTGVDNETCHGPF